MKNLFADYQTSKLLKELGFNEETNACYWQKNGNLFIQSYYANWNANTPDIPDTETDEDVSAPLWQQVEEWLWEKHKFYICTVQIPSSEILNTTFHSTVETESDIIVTCSFDSPITASTEGIKAAVKWLGEQQKNNKNKK